MARKNRANDSAEIVAAGVIPPEATSTEIKATSPKTFEDLGLTRNEFLEVVDFFKELIRLDQKGK